MRSRLLKIAGDQFDRGKKDGETNETIAHTTTGTDAYDRFVVGRLFVLPATMGCLNIGVSQNQLGVNSWNFDD
jgi:hypothetical protein